MNDVKIKIGRQWEEGVLLPVSDDFFAVDDAKKQSITEKVYHELRRMILNNSIAPGSWLRQDAITMQLRVSRTPVREALRSLNREGLVELVPNYGAKVSKLTIDEFEEIYAHRIGIEGLAVKRAVVKLSIEHLEKLEKMVDDLTPLVKTESLEEYLKNEWSFRFRLYSIGGRERFLAQILDFRERAERYLKYAYINENSIHDSFDHHIQLLKACKKFDVVQAEKIVQLSLNRTLEKAGPIIASNLQETKDQNEL